MSTENRTTIRLRVNEDIDDEQIAGILHGIEEEGVPVEVTRHGQVNPLVLAHEASVESRLGVGVGVSLDYVVITTEKLPAERPYIATTLNKASRTGRAIGTNAARLVKRMPLVDLHGI